MLTATAQDTAYVNQLMKAGIEHAKNGRHDQAIIEYAKALEEDPKNAFVNYEIALSNYYLQNNSGAVKYARAACKDESEVGVEATILLGTVYDKMGDSKKSVKAFKKGIKRFGDYYLLWFNLGVSANHMGDYPVAANAFEQTAIHRLEYLDAHYSLSAVKRKQRLFAEAMIPLYFYLLLDPNSDQSKMALRDIEKLKQLAVRVDSVNKKEITIELSSDEGKSQSSSDFILAIVQASSGLDGYDTLALSDRFIRDFKMIFGYLASIDHKKRDDIYTRYYIPMFAALAQTDHVKAFGNYITQSVDPQSAEWVKAHTEELSHLFEWLDEQPFKPGDEE